MEPMSLGFILHYQTTTVLQYFETVSFVSLCLKANLRRFQTHRGDGAIFL
jgi:hypothetical protein